MINIAFLCIHDTATILSESGYNCTLRQAQMSIFGTKCLGDGAQRKDRLYVRDFFSSAVICL